MVDDCITKTADGVVLTIHVQARAAQTAYVGFYGEKALKFRVAAPPADGAANAALCRFLAKQFHIPQCAVVLTAGVAGRHKRVLLKGLSVNQVKEGLGCHER
ncbi:MAG: UPF0235 protein [Nitrospirales bacterium]|nr:MAG: UPF0235 protein [Nitrospirales bacterium]